VVGQQRRADDRAGELEGMPDLVQDDSAVDRQEGNGEEGRVAFGTVPDDRPLARCLRDTEDPLVVAADTEGTEERGRVGGTRARAAGDYEALDPISPRQPAIGPSV
jgi:hypothetical protein